MAKLKIGIIGTGGISEVHIEGYKKHADAEVYALCDINKERAEASAKRHGVPLERVFTDKAEMLRAVPELDAVSVCTWNNEHAPCTIAALKAGKHVLCEKPMAMNSKEAMAMKAAAEKAGKLLMIGFVRRHGNDAKLVKDFVDNGHFGDIYYAKAAYLRRNGNPGGWFSDKARSGGGPLIDLGVHVIDFVRYVMGNPQPVSVYGATFHKLGNRANLKTTKGYLAADAKADTKEICDVEDLATALIRFDNGAVLSVEASFSLNIKHGRGEIEGVQKTQQHIRQRGFLGDASQSAKTPNYALGVFHDQESERSAHIRARQHLAQFVLGGTVYFASSIEIKRTRTLRIVKLAQHAEVVEFRRSYGSVKSLYHL